MCNFISLYICIYSSDDNIQYFWSKYLHVISTVQFDVYIFKAVAKSSSGSVHDIERQTNKLNFHYFI